MSVTIAFPSQPASTTVTSGTLVTLLFPESPNLASVEFRVENTRLAIARTAPFAAAFRAVTLGTKTARATVKWKTGETFTPLPMSIDVIAVPPPPPPIEEPPPPPPPVDPPPPPPPVEPPPTGERLLRKSNLVYIGSFGLPAGYQPGNSKFGYPAQPGNCLAFARDTRTMFLAGFVQEGKVSEVAIPELVDVRTTPVNIATQLQPFGDPTDGRYTVIGALGGNGYNIGGLLVDEERNRLLLNGFAYYDANHSQNVSLFTSGRDFQVLDDAKGPVKIGDLRCGYTTGYMLRVPPAWQAALDGDCLAGMFGMSIISRTSYGPAAFAFNVADVTGDNPVPATPLLYYPPEAPLAPYDGQSLLHNGTSKPGGAVFPEGWDSVLFFYRHGIGPFCYGSGCVPPRPNANYAEPYVSQVLAYRASDLAKAGREELKPWEVKPYERWEFEFPIRPLDVYVVGVTYDARDGIVYLMQQGGERPLIHAYRVEG